MAKKQVPVVGGLRKVINIPDASQSSATTIAGLNGQTVTIAQLRALLGLTTTQVPNTVGAGNAGSLIVGPGLNGGGPLVGPVPLNLTNRPQIFWDDALLPDDWVIGGGAGSNGITFTDGTHTVSNATALTVSGGTIGGATPSATLTISGSGGVAVPGTIPDLLYWFESDNLLVSNGNGLLRMLDRTPWLANHANQLGTGATGTTSTLNSLATLSFPGSAAGRYSFQLAFNLASAATLFVVAKPASVAGTQAFTAGAQNSLEFRLEAGGALGLVQTQTANIAASTGTFSTSAWTQGNATYNSSTGAYAFRVARAASGSGTNAKAISAANSVIGYNVPANGEDLTGLLAALIIYNRVLSNTEITNVENYLFSKWGV